MHWQRLLSFPNPQQKNHPKSQEDLQLNPLEPRWKRSGKKNLELSLSPLVPHRSRGALEQPSLPRFLLSPVQPGSSGVHVMPEFPGSQHLEGIGAAALEGRAGNAIYRSKVENNNNPAEPKFSLFF